jgi:hypothetical protein
MEENQWSCIVRGCGGTDLGGERVLAAGGIECRQRAEGEGKELAEQIHVCWEHWSNLCEPGCLYSLPGHTIIGASKQTKYASLRFAQT